MRASMVIEQFVAAARVRGDDVFVRLEEGDTYFLGELASDSEGIRLLYGKRRGARSWGTEVSADTRIAVRRNQLVMRDIDDESLAILAIPRQKTEPTETAVPSAPAQPGLMQTPEDVVTATEGEYVGKRFGKLTVTAMLGFRGRNRMARCLCECGGHKDAIVSQLRAGKVISCGCQRGLNNAVPIEDGTKIGRLVVLGRAPRPEGNGRSGFFYRVRCECGTEAVLIQERIVRPKVATCGCNMRDSIVGHRYGSLTVLPGERHANRHREHSVLCDCGNKTWARNDALRSGKTSSCGCLRGQPRGQQFSS